MLRLVELVAVGCLLLFLTEICLLSQSKDGLKAVRTNNLAQLLNM